MRSSGRVAARWTVTSSLLARVAAANLLVYGAGAVALATGPIAVPRDPEPWSVTLLVLGVLALTGVVALLLGPTLRALDQVVEALDLTGAAGRVAVPRPREAARLATAVDELLDRVERAQADRALAVTDAEEAERARIAQDLHDGVGQSLTAVLLELAAAERAMAPEARASVASAREGVRAALEEVRAAARRLRPHVLEDLGLRSALVALTTDLFAATDVAVQRAVVPGLPDLPEASELVVFRVAQEALTNVARHAGARTVRLRLGPVGSHVELVVEDDGCGLDLAGVDAVRGTGLRGMAERAASVGGTLTVVRREGGGTRVRLLVPSTAGPVGER